MSLEKTESNKKAELKLEIEYESVTVKIPKNIMDLLRFRQKLTDETPESYVAYSIVENIRSQMDVNGLMPTGRQLTDQFSLNKIFIEILDDPITEPN